MRTFIFAIGGSGARVLRSLTMLLAAGADKMSTGNQIVPIIVDYDLDNGDTNRTQLLLECYQRIHNDIYRNTDNAADTEGRFFAARVQKLKDLGKITTDPNTKFDVFLGEGTTHRSFASHIGFETLTEANGTASTRHLLEVLYDNSPSSSPTAELNLNLDKGFKGCPNIGCVITKRLKDTPELKYLFQSGTIMAGDRIIIIGSIFGGTGASGIPMLLDIMQEKPHLHNIPKAVIAVTPYFNVSQDNNSAINSDTFTAKTKAALDAYTLGNSVNEQATNVYYVGDPCARKAFENYEGSKEQKNDAHVVELAAAMMALHFVNANNSQQLNGGFEMGMENGCIFRPNGALTYNDFLPEIKQRFLNPLLRFALFTKFCELFWAKTDEGEKRDTWLRNTGLSQAKDLKKNIMEFIKGTRTTDGKIVMEGFNGWLTELGGEKRPFKLVNADAEGWDNIFPDIRTSERGFLGTKSYIDTTDLRGDLGKEWSTLTENGKKDPLKDRPGYQLTLFAKQVFGNKLAEVLTKQVTTKK